MPAGCQWRDLAARHGAAALDVAVRDSGGYRSAFAVAGAAPAAFAGPEPARAPARAVFYHVVYPSAEDRRAQAAAAIAAKFDLLDAAAKHTHSVLYSPSPAAAAPREASW